MAKGNDLRALRRTAGLRQAAVAEAAGIPRPRLSDIETEKRIPSFTEGVRIINTIMELRRQSGEGYDKVLAVLGSEEGSQ